MPEEKLLKDAANPAVVQWTVTLKRTPMAFPGQRIEKGKYAMLSRPEAVAAVKAELAVSVARKDYDQVLAAKAKTLPVTPAKTRIPDAGTGKED